MRMSTKTIKWVLAAGSLVFLVSALVLLVAPGVFEEWIGLVPGVELDWALRMVGACLLGLSGQMWLVRRGDELAIRRAAAVMVVTSLVMALLTVAMPASGWSPLRWGYLGAGLGFAVVYLLLLIGIRRRPAQRELDES